MLSASVQVSSPLLVAAYALPSTVTSIVAAVSSTVPLNKGEGSLVASAFTATAGAVASTTSSSGVESEPSFPTGSLAVTWTS